MAQVDGLLEAIEAVTPPNANQILTMIKTVDGAGSGLDADLLDGQHASYFLPNSDFTASNVLTLIKTVDGSGSGLDADLLDGLDSTYFLANSSFTAANILTLVKTVDGSGSGLDADLLDGYDSDAFPRKEENAPITGNWTYTGVQRYYNGESIRLANDGAYLSFFPGSEASRRGFIQHLGTNFTFNNEVTNGNVNITAVGTGVLNFNGNKVWTLGNDGAGSGLDADLLDGRDWDAPPNIGGTTANTATFTNVTVTGNVSLNTNSTYINARLSGGSSTRILGVNGSNVVYVGPIDAAASSVIINSATASGPVYLYSNGASVLSVVSNGNVGIGTTTPGYKLDVVGTSSISGNATFGGTVTLFADPVSPMQAATKQYIDNVLQSINNKKSVRAATTANITLSGTQTIDGVSVIAGNRVLVKNQTTQSQNGIYVVAAGAWARSDDADVWSELVSAIAFVQEGTVNKETGWQCTVDEGGTLGTTNVTWEQFAGVGTYTASNGVTKVLSDFQLTGQALALHNLSSSGLITRTGSGTVAARSLTAPAAGLTISNSDGVSGNPTFALANDLAAAEGLTTTGFVRRTGTDTWTANALSSSEVTTALGYTPWHAGNDGAGSGLDADLFDGQNSTLFNRYQSVPVANNGTALDAAFDNGFGTIAYSGYSTTLQSFNALGSVGTIQQEFFYALGSAGPWKIRNKLDNTTWQPWRYVVLSNSAQALANGTIWNAANDGAGSGLDADLLDGLQASVFALRVGDTIGGTTISTVNTAQALLIKGGTANHVYLGLFANSSAQSNRSGFLGFGATGSTTLSIVNEMNGNILLSTGSPGALMFNSSIVWHQSNDGSGSGLDADLLDGLDSTYFLAASSYTAADVLSKLLTVDGSGSGLDADLLDGLNPTSAATNSTIAARDSSGNLTAANMCTTAVSGNGLRLWAGDPGYSIYMSIWSDATYGGRISGDSTSDYNMYFRMRDGTNRGFVFKGGSGGNTIVGSLDASGHWRVIGNLYSNGSMAWTAANDGAGSGLDADLLDGQNGTYYLDYANQTNRPTWTRKTGTYTAVSGDLLLADTTSSGFTITLPASPGAGDTIHVQDTAGTWDTNNLTIAPGSKTIRGCTGNLTCDQPAYLILVFDGTLDKWIVTKANGVT